MFRDPLQYTFSGYPKIDRNEWKTVEVKQNDVLFFPGFLHHMTEKNHSHEDRLVMTVTISVDIFKNERL
jgi:ectoine hydroxylase-related dioxygenase (phytanoyl-CoA dioxygenase family)